MIQGKLYQPIILLAFFLQPFAKIFLSVVKFFNACDTSVFLAASFFIISYCKRDKIFGVKMGEASFEMDLTLFIV